MPIMSKPPTPPTTPPTIAPIFVLEWGSGTGEVVMMIVGVTGVVEEEVGLAAALVEIG